VILHCSYEELRALAAGAELVLAQEETGGGQAVAAPAGAKAQVELLLPRLTGDLSVTTLAEQRRLREAVALICDSLRRRLEGEVVAHDPAYEEAVNLYFEYGHALRVLDRLDRMGEQMRAMIELMTGHGPTEEAATTITFPD